MDKARSLIITAMMALNVAGCALFSDDQIDYKHQAFRGTDERPSYGAAENILIGPLIQTRIAQKMEAEDLMQVEYANKLAHQSAKGAVIPWSSAQSGYTGSVEVLNDGYSDTGNYCREYLQTLTSPRGRVERAIGVFCNNYGVWQIEYL